MSAENCYRFASCLRKFHGCSGLLSYSSDFKSAGRSLLGVLQTHESFNS
jgi:hypothetical protein